MVSIGVAAIKARLSEFLRRVERGESVVILDHKRPVALLSPIGEDVAVAKPALSKPHYRPLTPLITADVQVLLRQDREERW